MKTRKKERNLIKFKFRRNNKNYKYYGFWLKKEFVTKVALFF